MDILITCEDNADEVEASSDDNNYKQEIDKDDNYEYKWGTENEGGGEYDDKIDVLDEADGGKKKIHNVIIIVIKFLSIRRRVWIRNCLISCVLCWSWSWCTLI